MYPDATKPTGVVITTERSAYLFDGAGKELWRYASDQAIGTPATVADVDGDGKTEVLFSLISGGVCCLNADGALRWQYAVDARGTGYDQLVAADVLAASPGLELLIGYSDGWLRCISAQGKERWRFFGDKFRVSPAAVADLDGDGTADIIYGTDNGHIYCLNGAGQVKWRYAEHAPYGRSGPNIVDLNNDGRRQVLITRSNVGVANALLALDAQSTQELWRTQDTMQGYISNATVDLDGDGRQEVLHADKGNWLYCENADGTRRWAVELAGNGIFQAPAVADIDGDGRLDIVIGVRDKAAESGACFYVVGDAGVVRDKLALGGDGNHAPAIGDLDGDGKLEVVLCTGKPDAIHVLTWNGGGLVAWPSIRGNSAMTGTGNVPIGAPGEATPVQAVGEATVAMDDVTWGENVLHLTWAAPAPEEAFVEVSVASADGGRETRIANVKPGATQVAIPWRLAHAGEVMVSTRLFTAGNQAAVFAAAKSLAPQAPEFCRFEEVEAACNAAVAIGVTAGADTKALVRRLAALRGDRDAVAQLAASNAPPQEIADQASALRREARALSAAAAMLTPYWTGGDRGSFVWWQDANPWDTFDPNQTPAALDLSQPVRISAYGDEFESVAINLLNVSAEPTEVRCAFVKPNLKQDFAELNEPPLAQHVTLRRAVQVPGHFGNMVNDALPELDLSRTITLAPGAARQLWLVVDTRGLEPGKHALTLYIGSLAQAATYREIPLEIEVWPVKLPPDVYAKMNWASIDRARCSDQQLKDMLDHGNLVAMGPTLPSIKVDAEGAIAGPVDWTSVDAALDRLPKFFQMLFNAPPALVWPEGVKMDQDSAVYKKAYRASILEMAAHFASKGFGYDTWAFYPYDEPWNTGFTLVPKLKEFCLRTREADPKARIYADPAGLVRAEYLEEFKDLIDIWQPEMNTLKRDPKLVEWFHMNAKTLWAYEATDPGKDLLPLGYYRGYAWLAWMFGLDGAGFWDYKGLDIWWPLEGTSWEVVYPTGDQVVPSRRWEASRDGGDDYKALYLLREEIAKARAAGRNVDAEHAQALIDEAVERIIAGQAKTIDEITRQTRDYEIDFNLFQEYRAKIAQEIIKLRGA